MTGCLILAATPIGNLEDVSTRLARVLKEADGLYCEDTRQTRKLLQRLELSRELRAFHEHSEPAVLEQIAERVAQGEVVVYVSDAGMPGISDPGYELVNLAHERDLPLDVLPGPSAVINALVLSGLPNHRFCFMGFFPAKQEKRRDLIDELRRIQMTSIHFESPNRIGYCLEYLNEMIPETTVALCREMTKLHQQVLRGTPAEVARGLERERGEFVLVVGPVVEARVEETVEQS